MSTILKALKRLETEKENLGPAGSSTNPSFSPQHTLRRNSSFALLKKRAVSLLVAALILMGTAPLVWEWLVSTPQQNQLADRQRPAPPESTGPTVIRDGETPPVGVATPAEELEDESVPDRGFGRDAPGIPDQASPHGDSSLANEPPSAPPGKPDPYAGVRRMTGGRVKVQAIAWAPDTVERMAVVNNHIVRVGETLEGLFIVNIDRDAIIVRDNGQLYKIFFGDP